MNLLRPLLVAAAAALVGPMLTGQATVSYSNGQTIATPLVIPPFNTLTLSVLSGLGIQTGVVSGTGSLFKTGAGTLELAGANTFIGPVQVNAGTLNIFHSDNLGPASNPLVLNGGAVQSAAMYSTHTLQVNTASTIDVAKAFTRSPPPATNLVGAVQAVPLTGSGTLTKTGAGTFYLAGGGNTFSGNIVLAPFGGEFSVGAFSFGFSNPPNGASLSAMTSANTITVHRGARFSISSGIDQSSAPPTVFSDDRIGSVGNRPAVVLRGGTFAYGATSAAGAASQTLGPLILASGASTVAVGGTGGVRNLIFSSLSRNPGAFANMTGSTDSPTAPHIVFNAAPFLVGGGGAANSTTISIIPGVQASGALVTYGDFGVRALTDAEYNTVAGNNINGAGATDNVKISSATPAAFVPLSGAKTINALVNSAPANATWAMAHPLTLTSGQFIHTPANSLNITSGALTAGTGAAGTADLDMTIRSGIATVTLAANVTDNGSTRIILVKNGAGTLALTSLVNNDYSGGTFVNEGTLTTGSAGSRYLGTGAVVVEGGAALVLGAPGASSFSGSFAHPTYTVRNGGALQRPNTAPTASEFFRIDSGGVIINSGLGAGGMDLDTNLSAAYGAILAETASGVNLAIIRSGAPIQFSVTTPGYYFGILGAIHEDITVGAGTPWLGVSSIGNTAKVSSLFTGNITANSDFVIQSPDFGPPPAFFSTFVVGFGVGSADINRIYTPNGDVRVSVVGSVALNNDNSEYGSAGHRVVFQVTPGAALLLVTANAQGIALNAATAPASILVQNGGSLVIQTGSAVNGPVTILPGGSVFAPLDVPLTGPGTFTHANGSILNLGTGQDTVRLSTQPFGTVAGTIVRISSLLQPGTTLSGVTQFDGKFHDAAVFEFRQGGSIGNAAAATDFLLTLSASDGVGGVLTNSFDNTVLFDSTGRLIIGLGGATFAATTRTTLVVSQDFALGANTLVIGSAQWYNGLPKLGTVSLGSQPGQNTGTAGSLIRVLGGATLQLQADEQIPDSTLLLVDSGATVSFQSLAETVRGVTLAGGAITGATLVLTSTSAFDLQSGSVSVILGGGVGLNKTTAGTLALSRDNIFTGPVNITQGKLITQAAGALGTGLVNLDGGVLAPHGTLTVATLVWKGGALQLAPAAGDILNVTNALSNAGGGHFLIDVTGLTPGAYALVNFGSTDFALTDFSVSSAIPGAFLGGQLRFNGNSVEFNLVAGDPSGPLLQNTSPGFIDTAADFTVIGNVVTGGPFDDNTVNSLTFTPGGSLFVANKLTITSGKITQTGGLSTIDEDRGLLFAPAGFHFDIAGSLGVNIPVFSPGGLVKTGGGTLTFSKGGVLGGITSIQQGALVLSSGAVLVTPLVQIHSGATFKDNGVLVGNVDVFHGGWLKGSGAIIGNVLNSGTVAPGNSPGTLTILGNYTQTRAGTLQIEIASRRVFDVLVVSGTARLAGKLDVRSLGANLAYGDQYPFLQAGRIVGKFDRIAMPRPNLFRGRFLVEGGTGILLVAPTSYTLVAKNENQREVARALDKWIGIEDGDVGEVTLALDLQTAEEYPASFDAIGPAYYSVLPRAGIERTITHNSLLQQRMSNLRAGVSGTWVQGANVGPTPPVTAKNALDVKAPKEAVFVNPNEDRWSTWLQLSGQFAEIESFQSLAGGDFRTAGALVGVDYRISRDSAIGLAIGYDYTEADFDGGDGSQVDDGRISAYATFGLGRGFYLNATAGVAFSSYELDRPIRFSFIDRTAHGETDGTQAFAGLELGKDVHLDNWTITPSIGLQYTYLNINGLTETDAGVLGLTLDDFHAQSLCLDLGIQVSYRKQLNDRIRLTPYVNVYWLHELTDEKEEIRAALPVHGGNFSYHGNAIGSDRVLAGVGIFIELRSGITINFGYQSDFGDHDYTSHLIFVQASKSF